MLFRERQLMNSFKPGYWVYIPSLNTEPVQYRSDLCHLGLELWQPKPKEWCWFWNRDKPNKPKLKQLYSINYEHDVHWTYKTIDCKTYQHCEPFIGQLPTFIKDQS